MDNSDVPRGERKITFVTNYGLVQFARTLYRLQNEYKIIERTMNIVFNSFKMESITVHLNNC